MPKTKETTPTQDLIDCIQDHKDALAEVDWKRQTEEHKTNKDMARLYNLLIQIDGKPEVDIALKQAFGLEADKMISLWTSLSEG